MPFPFEEPVLTKPGFANCQLPTAFCTVVCDFTTFASSHQFGEVLLPQRRISTTAVAVRAGGFRKEDEASALYPLHQRLHGCLVGIADEIVGGIYRDYGRA